MFKGTQGIILVYDISNRDTFLNIKKWANHIRDSAEKDVCVLLVGNKLDKDSREVTYEEGENIAKECKFLYIEMSAKTNQFIKEGFDILIEQMYKTYGIKSKQEKISIIPSKNGKNKKNCC
jgi:Ras-related protein Rab-1A